VATEDKELTHVGAGTPCGEYLRRFWLPVALTSQLTDLPLALRVMGEDLVMFHDLSGRIGLLHKACSHRRTSLEYDVISERGIRCCYHGWLFDVDGKILETPGEPENSPIKGNLCQGAYPVREYKGLDFA
jgi:phenylpropionate dioxygenase-like ring-hydroxylating dioxygenase large terminal subunit